jgi:enoyl-CoA hydratase/carnithine racemase
MTESASSTTAARADAAGPNTMVEELEPGIFGITLNRPHRRNALSQSLLIELHAIVDEIASDPAARVVVLQGAGPAWCAGADMKGGEDSEETLAQHPLGRLFTRTQGDMTRSFMAQEMMAGLFEKIHRVRLPFVAAIDGPAHGGGFAHALACDIRIASPAASFGAVFIKRGVSACDMGTSYLLPRFVGAARSAELLLTGRVFDAAEAERIGLLVDVVPSGSLLERAMTTARQIAANPPLAVWMTKETMWQTVDSPSFRQALDIENRTQIMCTGTGELHEAFKAFVERRQPEWKGL